MVDFQAIIAELGEDHIFPLLDDGGVEAFVALSRTCPAVLVDPASGKLKCPTVRNGTSAEVAEAHEQGRVDWQSAPARLPHYVPNLFNNIHWPSVKTFHHGFPFELASMAGGAMRRIPNAHMVQLPMLASSLMDAEAVNFEELLLNMTDLIGHEGEPLPQLDNGVRFGGALQDSYELLGDGLSRCRSLKRLGIHNDRVEQADDGILVPKYSRPFLAALIPLLQASRDTLEVVTVFVGDVASNPEDDLTVETEFWESILLLPNLKKLQLRLLCVDGDMVDSLIDASKNVKAVFGGLPSRALEVATLHTHEIREQPATPAGIGPFLSLFADVATLTEVHIIAPKSCWDAQSFVDLGHVFRGKPLLKKIQLNFRESDDDSDIALDHLQEFLDARDFLQGYRIVLKKIGFVDEDSDSYEAVRGYQNPSGEFCLQPGDGPDLTWCFELVR